MLDQILFFFPSLIAAGPDPHLRPSTLTPVPALLVVFSDHPLPSVAGTQEERERYHIFLV